MARGLVVEDNHQELKRAPAGRLCEVCGKPLSQYNKTRRCQALHSEETLAAYEREVHVRDTQTSLPVPVEAIIGTVLAFYGMEREEVFRNLRGIGNTNPAVEAKRVLTYLLHYDAKLNAAKISVLLGGAHETTVRATIENAEYKYSTELSVRQKIAAIRARYALQPPP